MKRGASSYHCGVMWKGWRNYSTIRLFQGRPTVRYEIRGITGRRCLSLAPVFFSPLLSLTNPPTPPQHPNLSFSHKHEKSGADRSEMIHHFSGVFSHMWAMRLHGRCHVVKMYEANSHLLKQGLADVDK